MSATTIAKSHHTQGTRAQILHVQDNHACHYTGTQRNCEHYEPHWVAVREGSGREASAVAHFFDQSDLEEYVAWKNEKQST